MRSRGGVIVAMAMAFVAALLAPAAVHAQETTAEPTDIPGLEAAFGIADIRSDYVVVIDTSGSMEQGDDPLYPKVRDAYSGLVDAIPDGDRLTLVTFDATPAVRPNITVGPETREEARQLPPADGQYTDIGAALNSAVEALDQPDAASIQTVIFITDGVPQPPPGSPFDPVGSDAWVVAREHASALEARRTIDVRALGLTDAGKQGADLAAQVFATPEIVYVPSDQLRDYLTTEVRNTQRRLLETEVQNEIDNSSIDVKVTPEGNLGDQVKVRVELTSRVEHLGVDVNLEAVSAKDFKGQPVRSSIVDGSRTLHLSPGGSASFEVLLKPEVERPPVFSLPPPGREEIDVTLDFTQSANATPTAVLRDDLGVDTNVRVGTPDPFTVGRDTGKTWARFALELLVLAIVLLIAYAFWRKFIRKPNLHGVLRLSGGFEGGPEVRLKGKKMVIDASAFARAGRTKVKLYTRRGKKAVFIDRIGAEGSFEVQRKHQWKPVEAGSAMGIATYRIDGDGGTKFRHFSGEDES